MIIGVISDTHIPRRAKEIPEAVMEAFASVDRILHAGDLVTLGVIAALSSLAPVDAVFGNCDPEPVRMSLPEKKVIEAGGFKIGLAHGDKGPQRTTPLRALHTFEAGSVDCIVFGHSHRPYCQRHEKLLLFNPGSPTDRRWGPQLSYGILRLEETIQGEIIGL
ncbi:MAG: metallophosphoesterase family protein [Armatimonadetes bacterium]|nr:metallophosphoesterase family protein [Armatimonadota bacterium]